MYAVNHSPLIDMSRSTTNCCALIEPADWDEQTLVFKDKPFVRAKVRSLLYIPLNMSSVMSKTQAAIDNADAKPEEWIVLSHDASPWYSQQYFAVSKEVPDLENVKLSGTFLTKVFEGPYKDAPRWHKQLLDYVNSKGMQPLKTYFFYTMCPKCAKDYGKNYVVGLEQIAA